MSNLPNNINNYNGDYQRPSFLPFIPDYNGYNTFMGANQLRNMMFQWMMPTTETNIFNYYQTEALTDKNVNKFSQITNSNTNSQINEKIKNEKQQRNHLEINVKKEEDCPKKCQLVKKAKKKYINKSQNEQSYHPDNQLFKNQGNKNCSQTKNVTKNFGKAIIGFILKNKKLSFQVIQKLGLDHQNFIKFIKSYRQKVNTIIGLRSFWIDHQNKFAKPIRILSAIFLRKYYLSYVFNSRVQNYAKSIKYRIKMLQSLSKPQQFTLLKDF